MEGMHRVALPRVLRPFARMALSRAALVGLAALTVAACAAAGQEPQITSVPTFTTAGDARPTTRSTTIAIARATSTPFHDIPDAPTTTGALAIARPQRGSTAPIGAVVFGTDLKTATHSVNLTGERTTFVAGGPVAWRVTLPAAMGGESVRVTVTTESDTEMVVDEFVAQPGWNVYYGKSDVAVAPGTYVLHYLVGGHEVGSGTFTVEDADLSASPTPESSPIPASTSALPTI